MPAPTFTLSPMIGVAQVGQVVGLGALAQRGLLGLDEVADVGPVPDFASRAQVGVGPTMALAPMRAPSIMVPGRMVTPSPISEF